MKKYDIVFIGWRKLSRRTINLSKKLNIPYVLIKGKPPYINSIINTISFIKKEKPKIVLAQLPQGPLLYLLFKYKNYLKYKLISDVHTGFLIHDDWRSFLLNYPFKKYLKYCDLIILHNEKIKEIFKENKEKILIVYDPLFNLNSNSNEMNYIVLPSSWNKDEPLEFIIKCFIKSECKLKLIITGDFKKNLKIYKKYRKIPRVIFTGYLDYNKYYQLISQSKVIITGTKREFTLLSSAYEAISIKKPLIVSETLTLKNFLGNNVEYYNYNEKNLINIFNKLNNEEFIIDLKQKIINLNNHLQILIENKIKELKNRIYEFLN